MNKFLTHIIRNDEYAGGRDEGYEQHDPKKCSQIDNPNSKPASVGDDRTLSNLDSKFDDNSLEQDDEGNLQFLNA